MSNLYSHMQASAQELTRTRSSMAQSRKAFHPASSRSRTVVIEQALRWALHTFRTGKTSQNGRTKMRWMTKARLMKNLYMESRMQTSSLPEALLCLSGCLPLATRLNIHFFLATCPPARMAETDEPVVGWIKKCILRRRIWRLFLLAFPRVREGLLSISPFASWPVDLPGFSSDGCLDGG